LTKKNQQKPKREITKRQLSRWQQQKRRQRIIFGSGIFVIVAALVTIIVGWYTTQYQPMHETIIEVNGTSFNMNYYINTLKLYGQGQPEYYMDVIAEESLIIIERNELIRREALKLGFSVSDDEVKQEFADNELPFNNDYIELFKAEMLISKLMDDYFEQQIPLFAEQTHIMAMFLETEGQAISVRTRLEAGEDLGELAGELSLESISQTNHGDLGWRPKDVLPELLGTSVLDDYAFNAQVGVLSQPIYDETSTKNVGYWLLKVSEREEDSDLAHVQGILLGSEIEAQDTRARLEAGEDFTVLAKELSQHETSRANDGDIGWSTPDDTMSEAFEDFAFDYEIDLETISEPIRDETVKTTGGFWLLKLLEKDANRKIEDDNRNILKTTALNEWVNSVLENPENKIERYLDEEKKLYAISQAKELVK
jgi:parvulin-like peptidyl-prolyl isomerase